MRLTLCIERENWQTTYCNSFPVVNINGGVK